MRLVFLDIDGVVNTPEYVMSCGRGPGKRTLSEAAKEIDPARVAHLQTIIDAFPPGTVKIVISSAWRYGWTIEQMETILKNRGLRETQVIGAIPFKGPTPQPREARIARWLNDSHRFYGHTQFRSFVILDDGDMGILAYNAVHVDGKVGLTREDANAAIRILREGE